MSEVYECALFVNLLFKQLQLLFGLRSVDAVSEVVYLVLQLQKASVHSLVLQIVPEQFEVPLIGKFELVKLNAAWPLPFLRSEQNIPEFSFKELSLHLKFLLLHVNLHI